MTIRRRKKAPASPFRSGYKTYGGTLERAITVNEVKAALPRHAELWDERDGTKAITVKKVPGQEAWVIRIIARGGNTLHVPALFAE